MLPISTIDLARNSPTRRQLLVGAGSAAACLAGLGSRAMAAALVDHRTTQLTAATFTPFVNNYLKVYADGGPMPTLRLVKVLLQPRGNRPAALRDPFSLILTSMDGLALTPEAHQVQLPDQRWVEMFLSPITADGLKYEAAFS